MNGLFRRDTFTGFGPCSLTGGEFPLFGGRGKAGRLRAVVCRDAPRVPGVYGMVDAQGTLIYIGKARSLRSRLLSYFVPSRPDKAAAIVADSRRLVWEPARSEFAALVRELELIRRWRPRWNVAGQPLRQRRVYLCLGRPPALYAFVAVRVPSTATACWGPFPGQRRTRTACDRLNDWFRLRDCPEKQTMRFADQNELFPVSYTAGCLRHEIGRCLAPCAAACSQADYAFHVSAAGDFLEGRDRTALDALERQIAESSKDLRFEQAAALNERREPLAWLWRHLERLREARTITGVYQVRDHDGGLSWYVLHNGVVRRTVRVPDDCDQRQKLMNDIRASKPSAVGVPGLNEVDIVLLVCGWFRRHKTERANLYPF